MKNGSTFMKSKNLNFLHNMINLIQKYEKVKIYQICIMNHKFILKLSLLIKSLWKLVNILS